MTDSHRLTDFIARIRWLGENGFYQTSQDYIDAADEIEKLMDALEPFADVKVYPVLEDTTRVYDEPITYGDIRAARAAYLGETGNE